MTSAMLQPPAPLPVPVPAATNPSSPTTKKRRRRAPATGASEDCFTCRATGVKCDRRRPYCGPCLEKHDCCEGYRTQLTWGVGVASRGKLRGLHLPVTTAQLEKRSESDKSKSTRTKATSPTTGMAKAKSPGYAGITRRPSPTNKLSIITNYDFVNMECPSSTTTISASAARTPSSTTTTTSHPSPPHSSTSLPSQRIKVEPTSTPAAASPMYSPHGPTAAPRYLSPLPPTSAGQYNNYPKYTPQPPPQQLMSPALSEYEHHSPAYSPANTYAMSAPPSSAPLYDLVAGVSAAPQNGGYYAPAPQWHGQQHQLPPPIHHGTGHGGHPVHAGQNGLQALLYDGEGMLHHY